MVSATRKILNTGTNKYMSAFRQMQRAIYSDNVYVSLNSNTITTDVRNDLQNLNEFWMTSCFMQRVVRDNYRLCFRRRDWQKSNIYDRYDPQKDPQEQNCYIFDATIGDGVLFLCVGNNQYNRTDLKTASVYKPSTGYTTVTELPSEVIELDDGYSWIALGQSDTRFTDSNWISLEVRDGISFFGSDEGNYVDDGVSLADFKTAICSPHTAGTSGAAGFYPVANSYDQTTAAEISAGNILHSIPNIKRFDAYTMQQALKISGVDTQINFVAGTTTGTGGLSSSRAMISLYEQIQNSPFTNSSPVGWYNEKIGEWENKEGSVEMIWLDTTDLSASDFIVTGTSKPIITVQGNGTAPLAEFIVSKLKEDVWEIRGVKISTNLITGNREVGSGNTHVEFVVENTNNNNAFENALRAFITPYGGLLKEENLYGSIIPINAFMMSVAIDVDDITNTLDYSAGNVPSPTDFDSYALVVDAKQYSPIRELGLDLPPNKVEFLNNLITMDIDPSGVSAPAIGDLIYEKPPTTGGDVAAGELIGIVQAIESPPVIGGNNNIAFTTTKPTKFSITGTVYIGSGSSFNTYTIDTTPKAGDVRSLTGTILHIGNTSFNISSSGAKKRLAIKYITRV